MKPRPPKRKPKPKRCDNPEIEAAIRDVVTTDDLDPANVAYDVMTETMGKALFTVPPLVWTDGDELEAGQLFGIAKALDIGRYAAGEGRIYEIPYLNPNADGHRAAGRCHEWQSGERDIPFSMFAMLVRAGAAGRETRSFLIGVDADGKENGFKFSVALAFRTPSARVGWRSSIFGSVTRDGEHVRHHAWGGVDAAHGPNFLGLLFHLFALIGDGQIVAKYVFDTSKLH